MGSYGSHKTWIPFMNNKDCSQGFCSVYCPQWCYIMVSPPPPPLDFPHDYDDSSPNFSPLVIAIVGILASVFLFITYYTIISKYCGNSSSLSRTTHHDPDEDFEDNHIPTLHEPWHVSTAGLDEALIKSIAVCKYKKGDGLVEVSDCSVCSVCLGEFQEDESLRLLPKCSHAFHLQCIDTWLKSHSNCPLCRANIVSVAACSSLQLPPNLSTSEAMPETSRANDHELVLQESRRSFGNDDAKNSIRTLSDLGNLEKRDTGRLQQIRRTVSMDHCSENHIGIPDVLRVNEDEFGGSMGEDSKSSHRKRMLNCVMSPISLKRSFSSGRFFLTKHGRGNRGMAPV